MRSGLRELKRKQKGGRLSDGNVLGEKGKVIHKVNDKIWTKIITKLLWGTQYEIIPVVLKEWILGNIFGHTIYVLKIWWYCDAFL